jgi:RNA polymerase sporulation-specific sigma factor
LQYNKVVICGVDTSELPVLRPEETDRLLPLAHGGDRAARQRLIAGNLRLVLSVIARFSNRGEPPDDLFQVGCIGLMKAVDNFDTGLDVRFSTYAVPMIVGELRRYLRDNSAIRVSRSLRDTAYRTIQTRERLTAENQREPDLDEIARAMGVDRREVVDALDAVSEPISLYEPIYSDGSDPLCVMDQVCDPDDNDETWLERIALGQAMERLAEREQKILKMRFFQGKTQTEVSAAIGISQAQVSRLEKTALNKVRKTILPS